MVTLMQMRKNRKRQSKYVFLQVSDSESVNQLTLSESSGTPLDLNPAQHLTGVKHNQENQRV